MDERLLTPEKCKVIFNSKYDGDYIFAFDNVADYDLIENKLKLLREYTDRIPKFYTFCGFDRNNKWDLDFWKQDLYDLFERIDLLRDYHCLPYIMRFNRYEESPYKGMYIHLARWCNQPSFFKKLSFREFCEKNQELHKNKNTLCSTMKAMTEYENDMPDLAYKYFEKKWM